MSLEEVWNEATKNLSRTVADEWWTKILEKYNKDGRNYHDFLHLEEKIQHFNSVKHLLKDPDAVALAIIFHYYEYDPKAVECEIKNCEHFSKFADESGIPKESPLHSGVIELLQAAATHSTDAHKTEGLYGSDDLHYFLDFDMAVLGSEPEHYNEYTAKVQQEYAFLPDSMYKSLRLKVKCEQKSHLRQHKETTFHIANVGRRNNKVQPFISAVIGKESDNFKAHLCEALVSANVPFHVLKCDTFKSFLEDVSGKKVPDESTLRKNYLDRIYQKKIEEIREDLAESYIWLSVDETTDSCGRFIANVVVGKLDSTAPGKAHLILCKCLDKTNHSTIACIVKDALRVLWPGEDRDDKFLLLLTDSAAYMLKAGEVLAALYPKMIHVTCLAHGLHRVAEEIRGLFPEVNTLISSVKKIFLKAPRRIQMFKEMLPGVPLPPEPVLTRWGTWLCAALYYAQHFSGIKELVETFDANEADSIAKAKSVLCNDKINGALAFLQAYFSDLPEAIRRLESSTLPLKNAIGIINTLLKKQVPGPVGEAVTLKLKKVLERYPGFEKMKNVCSILLGEQFSSAQLTWGPTAIASMKFAPMTSCEVERTFSAFKCILRDNRKNFSVENLERYLVIYRNQEM